MKFPIPVQKLPGSLVAEFGDHGSKGVRVVLLSANYLDS
jgi:hypothetical protein